MNCTVYVCFDCPTCDRVVAELKEMSLDVKIVNVQIEKPNIPRIQIFPSLYIDRKLVAFGDDILLRLAS